jgi:hypothetical protein
VHWITLFWSALAILYLLLARASSRGAGRSVAGGNVALAFAAALVSLALTAGHSRVMDKVTGFWFVLAGLYIVLARVSLSYAERSRVLTWASIAGALLVLAAALVSQLGPTPIWRPP